MRISTILLLSMMLALKAFSGKIKVTDEFTDLEIGNTVEYLLDEDKKLSVFNIDSKEYESQFRSTNGERMYFGFTRANIWLKFNIQSFSGEREDLLLECPYPLVKRIELFFALANGGYEKAVAGQDVKLSEWSIPNNTALFKIRLKPGEYKKCFMRFENNGIDFSLPLNLYNEDSYNSKKSSYNFSLGVFYGMILFIIIINIFFYISLRSKMYLHFTMYVISVGMFLLVRDGYAFKFFWPNCYWCAKQASFIWVILPCVFISTFAQFSLKTKLMWPLYHKIITGTIISILGITALSFAMDEPLYMVCNIIVIVCFLPLFILGIKATKESNLALPPYFLAGLVVMMSGSTILILKNYGFIEYRIGETGLKLGFVSQLLIQSFGLGAVYRKLLNSMHLESIENLKKLNQLKDQINIDLEKKVDERTEELNKKNNELMLANKQLGAERDIYETQRNLIAKQRQETTDSIRYAQRIQRTLIKSERYLKERLNDYFILDMPKDIVSGDFYWVTKMEKRTLVAVADCTGHGVPGAFMSIIAITYLNDIIKTYPALHPADILFRLRERIVSLFREAPEDQDAPKDGLDISLVSIEWGANKVEYAGAYNPLYIIRGRELLAYKGDRMPISVHEKEQVPFTNYIIDVKKNDILYLFTDGYVDQFGWRTGKKYKHNQFKELLLEINDIPIEAQKVVIMNTINNWKGDLEQVDDILIMGVKI